MTTTTLATTISYTQTYIALATLLPSNLRPCASCAGLCYLKVAHAVDAEYFFVHVAALPRYFDDPRSRRVFTVFFSSDQLLQALPFDRALQGFPTCDMRELVVQHTLRVSPELLIEEDQDTLKSSKQTQVAPKDECLVLLPELFVSVETAEDAAEVVDAPPGCGSNMCRRRWMLQYIWLQAAIMMIRRQMESAKGSFKARLFAIYSRVHLYLCRIFEACRRSRQTFVSACPVYIEDRQVGWRMVIGIPASLLVA